MAEELTRHKTPLPNEFSMKVVGVTFMTRKHHPDLKIEFPENLYVLKQAFEENLPTLPPCGCELCRWHTIQPGAFANLLPSLLPRFGRAKVNQFLQRHFRHASQVQSEEGI